MAEYGLTSSGPNPKRLDVILEEMHAYMTDALGVNTRQNPQSLLNHLLTNVADRLAELWEYGVDVYYSQYPSSAEGSSLDDALQFGGITRELAAPSYYSILCTGLDGTVIPAGTIISTDTNPATNLVLAADAEISRSSFNQAVVIPSGDAVATFSIVLNGELYAADTLAELADLIDGDAFTAVYADGKLTIAATDETSSNVMVLSENLTTETVGSIVTFPTEENGDILIPNGVITKITKAVTGLQSVVNVGAYIAGRLAETDVEFRQSHIDKIYNQSSRMVESIRSAILENVQGVESCVVYENDTNEVDDMGRWPHSVEVVADGGDRTEIARQILDTKAGGINTYCSDNEYGEVVVIPGEYGEDITIRFNRPSTVYIWFQISVIFSTSTNPPTNYVQLIKDTILSCMDNIEAGDTVSPKDFTDELYATVAGIEYFDIWMYATTDPSESPTEYGARSVDISPRERAATSESRIGVIIDG